MQLGIEGRTAIVCGSTAGLGKATAEALAAEGARVVVCGRRRQVADEVAARLPHAVAVEVDLLAAGAARSLVHATEAAFGPPDILVLNGPGPRPARVTEVRGAEITAAVDSLVTVHHELISQVLPGMRARGWGRILAVGSSSVVSPIGDLALSGVGRSAFASYLKMLANEVAVDGVTVNMLLPGRIATERVRSLDATRAERADIDVEAAQRDSVASIPMGRYGDPAEFGAVAAFLCGAGASYLTGGAIRCDGGSSPVL